MQARYILLSTLALSALVIDSIFAIGRYPILTILVCGIVLIYELVSPFIYSSR
jgi:hypothetical protein